MSQSTLTIGIKYDTKALNQLESQLAHIAELMDRIHGWRDNEVGKSVGFAGKIFVIDSAKINSIPDDDHIRQIVREELRQFVSRESERGGLFSAW